MLTSVSGPPSLVLCLPWLNTRPMNEKGALSRLIELQIFQLTQSREIKQTISQFPADSDQIHRTRRGGIKTSDEFREECLALKSSGITKDETSTEPHSLLCTWVRDEQTAVNTSESGRGEEEAKKQRSTTTFATSANPQRNSSITTEPCSAPPVPEYETEERECARSRWVELQISLVLYTGRIPGTGVRYSDRAV
ncbi:hypothetical protein DFH06DRAFT_1117902 [Mycena polygramma]|nr:hypothetical protein DFH06DRAFT_1117902 [Mycena polygramma]